MKNPLADNSAKKFSLAGKVFCILFGVFLTLAGLEFFLRFLGFGYNVLHRAPVDTGAEYRIYCVGESSTWGIGASDPVLKGYPRQLEEMLNKKYAGMKVQCFFDQTIGQNTSEILAKFPSRIEKYQPQLVIFLAGVNNRWNMDRSNLLLFNKNPVVSRASLNILMFLDQFRVWKLFKNMAFPLGLSKERWDFFYPRSGEAREELEKKKREGGSIFDELAEYDIGEMVRMCKANRIKTIMCTYPVTTPELRRAQRNVAQKFGSPLADHYEVFQKLEDRQAYLSPEDHWHPNDAGYAVMAKNVYNCILENGLINAREKKDSR